MNVTMVKRLILKDWYLQRQAIAGCIAAGVVSVAFLGTGNEAAFYAGAVLLVTVLIAGGVQLAMTTVLHERKEQTLAFVMSLPISAREYTVSKLVGNLLMFLIPWTTLVVACVAVVLASAALPNGMIPAVIIVLLEIFVSTSLIVGVGLVSESQAWTIGAMLFGNLFFNFFLYFVFHIPSIARDSKGEAIVWSTQAVMLLVGEIAAIALIFGATFLLQDRKADFI